MLMKPHTFKDKFGETLLGKARSRYNFHLIGSINLIKYLKSENDESTESTSSHVSIMNEKDDRAAVSRDSITIAIGHRT